MNQNTYGIRSLFYLFVYALLLHFPLASAASQEVRERLIYCTDPDWMPYEAIRDGEHVGISSDYLEVIRKHTNFDFELLVTNSWAESLEKLMSGECHLTLMLNQTTQRNHYLKFSKVYFRSPNILISRTDEPFLQGLSHVGDRKVAIVKNYRIAEYIAEYYPNLNTLSVSNESEGMYAIAEGEADVFVGSMLSLNARVQQHGFGQLKISGWAGPEDELRVGVIHSKEYLLNDINMAIGQITELERIDIFSKWNNVQIINETDYSLFYRAFSVLGVVLLFFIFRQFQMKRFNMTLSEKNHVLEELHKELERANQELKHLSFNDALTELYNRRYFSSHMEDAIRAFQRTMTNACLVLVDIDYFKQVNDKFGHAVGDSVLMEFAKLFKTIVRDADMAARWGGEEFILLLNDTSLEEGTILAERLISQVRANQFDVAGHLTISIGIAQYNHKESFEGWFDRTDKALYEAKSKGRDQCVLADNVPL